MLALGGFVEAAGTSEQARLVTVAVDGEQVTSPRETTAGGLLRAAGLDPSTRDLVRIEGRTQHPYPDPGQRIELHEGETFITVSTGPTPVS